jgi:hypothetical protein
VVDEAEKLVLNLSSEGGHMGGTIGGFETRVSLTGTTSMHAFPTRACARSKARRVFRIGLSCCSDLRDSRRRRSTAGVVDRPKNFSSVADHMVGERLRAPERSS